jgi:hypothetical protein
MHGYPTASQAYNRNTLAFIKLNLVTLCIYIPETIMVLDFTNKIQ